MISNARIDHSETKGFFELDFAYASIRLTDVPFYRERLPASGRLGPWSTKTKTFA
jgi:hypothetical protein